MKKNGLFNAIRLADKLCDVMRLRLNNESNFKYQKFLLLKVGFIYQ